MLLDVNGVVGDASGSVGATVRTVQGLVEVDRVLVVDDGSTDDTAARLIDAYGLEQVVPTARGELSYRAVTEVWRCELPHPITLIRKAYGI